MPEVHCRCWSCRTKLRRTKPSHLPSIVDELVPTRAIQLRVLKYGAGGCNEIGKLKFLEREI